MYQARLKHPYGRQQPVQPTAADAWKVTRELEAFGLRLREFAATPEGQARAEELSDLEYDRAVRKWELKTGRSWDMQREMIECGYVESGE